MDSLAQIKSKIDLVSFISEHVPLKKTGRNFKGLCPFHSEKTPSFIVSPERQIWHCFGCNAGGDVFEFVEKFENIEFPEALRILAKRTGVKLENFNFDQNTSQQKERLYQINHLASEYYHYLLLNHQSGKMALDYILKRGITNKSLEIFKIGYAPDSWRSVSKFLLKKGFSLSDLELAGLIIRDNTKNSYYDRFRGRLIFTLCDHRGNNVGFAGRVLTEEKEAKYINSPETPVYLKGNILYALNITKEQIRKQNQAVIVEGEIDAISSYQSGVGNVVAIKGSALTELQLRLLKRFCDSILLSLDADLAGDMAVRRGIELADNFGFSIKVIRLKETKDPNEAVQKNPGLWVRAVKEAVPVYDFYLESALEKFDAKQVEGAKRLSGEILPIFSRIQNLVVRDFYLKKLAKILDVDMEVLEMEAQRIIKEEKIAIPPTKPPSVVTPKSRQELLEDRLTAIVLQSDMPKIWQNELTSVVKFFQNDARKKIIEKILEFLRHNKKWDIKMFIDELPKEFVSVVDRLYLLDLNGMTTEEQSAELLKLGRELELFYLKDQLKKVSEELKMVKANKDLALLNKQFDEITFKLKKLNSQEKDSQKD